ncbi:bifunctional UDP-N-acetylglucosamine diphosphorylase/glucosamine-1-phosphate N-acetyltransferase GlmU (plasmid) [Radiobacillus kanasensis]|uniref:bifunctional UDP-N-acetylglucosamine diphosphorylase/glucosamine-1-phosphate N-acetyltransferase GlmU n=1 Tax=Radiobacillus kanasensis TaxID=2844358 RepID=UPI001E61E23E|nr:bifunctional UDP-N-acetylglucosamine diphosphorylase/glucosamine-1-phosphate N-acetyltransferase GlmU [Radiobacillus kanasensis]UFU01520.1 bifunctional UDP-N-acetylglucosamine diphosphorylase/glucosamine-1-phosphate N-acetyltransferase GlmU [Radiobacillus kanasensis]
MTNRYGVVLAAGQGTRMKSKLYKVLHPVMGRPMVQHVVDQLKALQLSNIITVVGFGSELVKEQLGEDSSFVLQEEQLGTGHAVLQAKDLLASKEGTTLVVCGDTPLLTHDTLDALVSHHEKLGAKATILTALAPEPAGYGRVLRNASNDVERIVEHKDASEEEKTVKEINTGTYCFDNRSLFEALENVSNDNAQGEYYLPDVIQILQEQGEKVAAFQSGSFEETLGINDRVALAEAEKLMKRKINEKHMRNGVTIIDPDHTYIGPDVEIEQDVVLYPGTSLSGKTVIKKNAKIGPNTEIIDCLVGEETLIKQSVAKQSEIGKQVSIGPFAHIRPDASIGNEVKIGNFVEVKKSVIEDKSKVSHLSYIGDAEIGKDVNVGCGTITVNYDGKNKHLTKIEDGAFIGCNSNLIAPVTIGKGAYVAAGSTINKNVPDEALSIARVRQENKEGYVKRFKK